LPAWDVICANQAALAIVSALLRRHRTGEGSEIRMALSDVAFSTLSHLGILAEAELERRERPAIGNHIYGAFGRDFETSDGRRVMVAAISSKQWSALVRACSIQDQIRKVEAELGLDFGREDQRFEGREAICALVEPWCKALSLREIGEIFDREGVCWGPYRSALELIDEDARVSPANPIFERLETGGVGEHLSAGAPMRFVSLPRSPTNPAPWVGEHTDEILSQALDMSDAEIASLHDRGIVAGPERDPFHPSR
jgi:2-methylfumaryl-CoA isomerase